MQAEHIQRNENEHTEECDHKQDHDDLVRKRLSLLEGWFAAFLEQALVDAADAHGARHRADENHPKQHPGTPPLQRTCWQKE
jgi:hypothetical protein